MMDESEKRFLAFLIVLVLLMVFTHCAHADEEFARDAQGCIYVKRPVPVVKSHGGKVVKRKPGKSTPATHPDEWDVIGCGDKAGPPPDVIFPPDTVVTFTPVPEVPPFEPYLPPGGLYMVPVIDAPPEVGPPVGFPPYLGPPPIYVQAPPPVFSPTPAIPEPETWLLLIGGGVLLAARFRERSRP